MVPSYKRAEIIRDGKQFPVFQKPLIFGFFSIDKDRRFLSDDSQLKYLYYKPKSSEPTHNQVNFNLNEGITKCTRKDEFANEKLDHIFSWLKTGQSKGKEPFVSRLLPKNLSLLHYIQQFTSKNGLHLKIVNYIPNKWPI